MVQYLAGCLSALKLPPLWCHKMVNSFYPLQSSCSDCIGVFACAIPFNAFCVSGVFMQDTGPSYLMGAECDIIRLYPGLLLVGLDFIFSQA